MKTTSKLSGKAASPLSAVLPFAVGILFFFAVCLSCPSSIKATGTLLLFLALGASFLCFASLRDRLSPPVLALVLVAVMGGISTCYAVSGKFALNESLKVLCALCLTMLLLAIAPKEEPGRWMACVLETFSALSGLVSIDLLSTRVLSGGVLGILGRFSQDYGSLVGVEPGVRMISLFDNPNVFAGVAGLGVLLALGLTISAPRPALRRVHLCLLYVNALSFLLAFSMGASATVAVAFVVYLLLERADRRSGLLVLMVETLVLTVISAALISLTSFQTWDGVQPIPLLCVLVGGAALCLLDRWLGARLAAKLRGKAILIAVSALLAVLLVFALVAMNLTGSVTLSAGESLRRAIYPDPAAYSLAVPDAPPDDAVLVTVESQNQQDTMMHTSTVLYQGALPSAAFSVPEDSLVVYVTFRAQTDVTLDHVTCAGGQTSYDIPLGYPLLPGFIANRLQGLSANENAIQRLVFFSDGMKLFRRSPIVGLGLGAFENGVRSVQSFSYETKYAHNHYIQTLVETGVVGLALFLALLGVSAAAVLLSRKKGEGCHPLTPTLGAALVFMAGHAATEVVFSTYAYLPIAFGAFALTGVCCADALPVHRLTQGVKTVCLVGLCALLLAFGIQLGRNSLARRYISHDPTMEDLVRAAQTDPFEWADYMLSYVDSAVAGSAVDLTTLEQADAFALRLAQVNSNTIPAHLAEYYFRTNRPAQALEMAEKYLAYVPSDPDAWQTVFALLRRYNDGSDLLRDGVIHVGQMLEEWNQNNLGTITLNEEAQAFLNQMKQ